MKSNKKLLFIYIFEYNINYRPGDQISLLKNIYFTDKYFYIDIVVKQEFGKIRYY